MTKTRVLVFLTTILIVGIMTLFVSYYARGYRLNLKSLLQGSLQFSPNGILAIKSEPDGASVFVNGELKTATSANLSLPPGTYVIEVKKEGFFTWSKQLVIQKEIVTNANVSLFKNAPSLNPITFFGAQNPIVSENGTKIAYSVPFSRENNQKSGLWTLDVLSLPLGFSNDPTRITDGDLTGATFIFSPDERQILLTTTSGVYLLNTGTFTPQTELVNILARKDTILTQWELEKKAIDEGSLRGLPIDITDILTRKSSYFSFSPDSSMVLYTASSSATLPEKLVRELPGSSSQRQERNILPGKTYIYDTEEDRNFAIFDKPITQANKTSKDVLPALRWLTTSRHILLAEENKITIMDYDGTNRQEVYTGSFISPFAFPYTNSTKLLILTNLGAVNSVPNLYTLTVK